jgi:hypothetical protein
MVCQLGTASNRKSPARTPHGTAASGGHAPTAPKDRTAPCRTARMRDTLDGAGTRRSATRRRAAAHHRQPEGHARQAERSPFGRIRPPCPGRCGASGSGRSAVRGGATRYSADGPTAGLCGRLPRRPVRRWAGRCARMRSTLSLSRRGLRACVHLCVCLRLGRSLRTVRRTLRRWLLPVTCAVQLSNYAVRPTRACMHACVRACVCVRGCQPTCGERVRR